MSEDFEFAFRMFCKSPDEVPDRASRLVFQFKEGWTDDKLRDLCRGLHFSPSAYSRKELKKILTRFYYLYCQGYVQEGDNVPATLNDVIAIAQTELGPIWEAPPIDADAFYTPNVSQTDNLRMVKLGTSHNPNLLRRFCDYVERIIEDIDPLGPSTKNETDLVRLTSFLGLTMYRFATKTSVAMANTFTDTHYKNNLITEVGWPADPPFFPPWSTCLINCGDAIVKGFSNTSMVFTIVVNKYIDIKQANMFHTAPERMLTAALLTDTAWYGLGLLHMMHEVTDILDIEWRVLRAQSSMASTSTSWKRIGALINSQIDITNSQYSFRWARVIDPNYFREMALKENQDLATVFGAVLAQGEDSPVWEAEWARQTVLSEDAKSIGRALYEMHTPTSDEAEFDIFE